MSVASITIKCKAQFWQTRSFDCKVGAILFIWNNFDKAGWKTYIVPTEKADLGFRNKVFPAKIHWCSGYN